MPKWWWYVCTLSFTEPTDLFISESFWLIRKIDCHTLRCLSPKDRERRKWPIQDGSNSLVKTAKLLATILEITVKMSITLKIKRSNDALCHLYQLNIPYSIFPNWKFIWNFLWKFLSWFKSFAFLVSRFPDRRSRKRFQVNGKNNVSFLVITKFKNKHLQDERTMHSLQLFTYVSIG